MNRENFIGATVNRCYDFFYDGKKKCYLLADETGLGKTIESKALIKKIYEEKFKEDDEEFRVLYIGPNLVLAGKNIKKLVYDKENTELVGRTDRRLSIKPTENENKKIKYWAITPAVSFFLDGGKKKELDEIKKDKNLNMSEEIKCKIECLKEQAGAINNTVDRSEINAIKDEIKKAKKFNDLRFDLSGVKNKDIIDIIDAIVTRTLVGRGEGYAQKYAEVDWTKKIWEEYCEDKKEEVEKERQERDFKEVVNSLIEQNCGYKYGGFEAFYKTVSQMDNAEEQGKIVVSYLTKIRNGGSTEEYIDELKKYEEDIRLFEKIDCHRLYTIYTNITEYIKEQRPERHIINDLRQRLINAIFEDVNEKAVFEMAVKKIYEEKINYLYRLAACIQNVKEWKPDLVIFDEFQNYPGLFNSGIDDEETRNVKLIMDAVTGNENGKILLLSATPYAYTNAVGSNDGESDEDRFLGHVGMEGILSYLNEKNNGALDHGELFKKYHLAVSDFVENYGDEDERESKYDVLCDVASEISRELLAAGISRNERPVTDYNLKTEDLCVDVKSVIDQPGDMLAMIKGDNGDPKRIRRLLSTPVYVSRNSGGKTHKEMSDNEICDINEKICNGELFEMKNVEIRVNAKKLLDDILPEETIPPIFVSPLLKDMDSVSKVIAFSAYTHVPRFLAKLTNERLKKNISDIKVNNCIAKGDDTIYREFLNNFVDCYLSQCVPDNRDFWERNLGENGDRDGFISAIKKKFESDRSIRIIVKTYNGQKISKDNYWEFVKRYCEENDLIGALREFFFLYYNEYKDSEDGKDDKISDYLNADYEFALSYTSISHINENKLMKMINAFQTPFYPFCFFLSSVAQEGLDFHWYCDRIVHWNVPSSPIAMLQREGRINRYRCFALRKELIKELKELYPSEFSKVKNMEDLFKLAEEKSNNYCGNDGFYPDHISIGNRPLPINRKCYYYPLSEEYFRWKELIVNMDLYRSLFGGWSGIEGLTQDMAEYIKQREKEGKSIMIDIRPSRIGEK